MRTSRKGLSRRIHGRILLLCFVLLAVAPTDEASAGPRHAGCTGPRDGAYGCLFVADGTEIRIFGATTTSIRHVPGRDIEPDIRVYPPSIHVVLERLRGPALATCSDQGEATDGFASCEASVAAVPAGTILRCRVLAHSIRSPVFGCLNAGIDADGSPAPVDDKITPSYPSEISVLVRKVAGLEDLRIRSWMKPIINDGPEFANYAISARRVVRTGSRMTVTTERTAESNEVATYSFNVVTGVARLRGTGRSFALTYHYAHRDREWRLIRTSHVAGTVRFDVTLRGVDFPAVQPSIGYVGCVPFFACVPYTSFAFTRAAWVDATIVFGGMRVHLSKDLGRTGAIRYSV